MSEMPPGGFADTPGPDATPEQDADVRALLALLRDEPLEMPPDVQARLRAVLAEERRAVSGVPAGAPLALVDGTDSDLGPPRPVTVLPPAGASRRGPSGRAFRIVGGLAAAALVVVGGVTVLRGTGAGTSSAGGEASASSIAGSARAAMGPVVTASGTRYAQATLAAQARTLASSALAKSAADTEGAPATPSAAVAGGTTYGVFTAGNVTTCVRAITDNDGSTALAVDSGSYAGRPAVVVVLPTQGDVTRLDVFVVTPACASGTPDIIEFQRVPAA